MTNNSPTLIENNSQLIKYFNDGIKDNNQLRIGVEHEKFLFNKKDLKRIDYEKIKKIFELLKNNGWELQYEKREGSYHCVGCGTKLFESTTKYESGSGWPSFFESIPGVFEEKKDMHIGYPRTEYHCKKCGGHHGHVFDDGPKPTGKRYCNNGICLVFKPKGE